MLDVLSSFWSPKNNPHRQIIGEIFKMVICSGGYKQRVSFPEFIAELILHENTGPFHYDVNFVLIVRSLVIFPCGCEKQKTHRSVAECLNVPHTFRPFRCRGQG